MVGCSAINCINQTKNGYQLFKLPTENRNNEIPRKAWLHNCPRKDKPDSIYFCGVGF